MQLDNSALAQQRTTADLQRRLAALEAVVKISGNDVTIVAPGNIVIRAGSNLNVDALSSRTDRVGTSYALNVGSNLDVHVSLTGTFRYGFNYSVTVANNQSLTVSASRTVNVAAMSTQTVGGNHALTAGSQLSLSAGGQIKANKAIAIGP